ncbi:hypothetical protein F2981_26555 (plasmid) [Sinorhizobium meliloti]|nr:hypothetical protein [Sinorhizobium meliloti]
MFSSPSPSAEVEHHAQRSVPEALMSSSLSAWAGPRQSGGGNEAEARTEVFILVLSLSWRSV